MIFTPHSLVNHPTHPEVPPDSQREIANPNKVPADSWTERVRELFL